MRLHLALDPEGLLSWICNPFSVILVCSEVSSLQEEILENLRREDLEVS